MCVVGDDDQSIYRWRGADVRNIRGFRKDYPDAKVVKLEQNYRSSKRIVFGGAGRDRAVADARARRSLWTANDEGSPIRVVACADERDEAAMCRPHHHRRAGRRDPHRRTSRCSTAYTPSPACSKRRSARWNLPYQIVGGTKFYERAEIKGRARLPEGARQSEERRGHAPLHQHAAAGASATRRSSA